MDSKTLIPIKQTTYAEIDAWERRDIQEWISSTPEVLGEQENSLLILTKELPVNDGVAKGIRLDLLALDRDGRLVVIELKRDDARGDVDWQAIKYAARCSEYSADRLVKIFSEHAKINPESAVRKIIEHIDGEFDEDSPYPDDYISNECLERAASGKLQVRIILVAREIHPDVAAAALWLMESSIQISCIRLMPYRDEQGAVFVVPEKIIPLPTATDYTNIFPRKDERGEVSKISQERVSSFDEKIPSFSENELELKLRETLGRKTNLTPRLREFLSILLSKDKPIGREEIKGLLHEKGVGEDIGNTGRLLSNISQLLTKREFGHLRQIVQYDSLGEYGQAGAMKTNYRISDEWRPLVSKVLNQS